MKFLQGLLLFLLAGTVVIFAVQNREPTTVQFLNWKIVAPMAVLVAAIYGLGMLSGWTVLAFVTRSIRRVAERRQD